VEELCKQSLPLAMPHTVMRWVVFFFFQLGNGIRQIGSHSERAVKDGIASRVMLCKQVVNIHVDGINADGEKVFQNVELDPEEYDWMGGRNIFSKSREDGNTTSFYLACDWQRNVPLVMSEVEGESGEVEEMSVGRFYTGHELLHVRLNQGERVEFGYDMLIWDVLTEGTITIRDSTGLKIPVAEDAQGTELDMAKDKELGKIETVGKKLCTDTVKLEVKGTAHVGYNITNVVKGVDVQFSPKEYMQLGGLKIMRKYVPGPIHTLIAQYEQLPALDTKTYWLRCNYDNGAPYLIMHHSGIWDKRAFDFFHLYKREVSVTSGWRLDFLADFAIPYEISDGLVTLRL